MPTNNADLIPRSAADVRGTAAWMAIANRWHLPHGPSGRQYSEAVGRFEAFARERDAVSQPASPETVTAYIERRRADGLGKASLDADARAIRLAHLASGLTDPTADPRVRCALGRRLPDRSTDLVPVESEPHSMALDDLERLVDAVRTSEGAVSPSLVTIDAASSRLKASSLARLTRKKYAEIARRYDAFCKIHDLCPLPADPTTVCRFLTEYGLTRSPSALGQARAAIRYLHDRANVFPSPTLHPEVQRVMDGHARLFGRPRQKKDALTSEQITAMCKEMDESGTVIAMRDKAMILLGFAGAFRRSEVTSRDVHDDDDAQEICLEIADVRFDRRGANVLLRKSKCDQEGEGQEVFITYGTRPKTCAVLALQTWIAFLKKRGITHGPVFRRLVSTGDRLFGMARADEPAITGTTLSARVKLWAKRIGLDPDRIGGHSLRSGHVTVASRNHASVFSIARQGRWKCLNTVVEYHRAATAHEDNSSSSLDL